jgi:RNA-binding protein YhbY
MPGTPQTIDKVKERALELGVYLPLGAYARVRDEISGLDAPQVRKVYTDLIDRGQKRVATMEGIVRRRSRVAERKVEATSTRAKKATRSTSKKATAASSTIAPKLPRVAAPRKASELPITGYGSLTAGEITTRLRGLTQTELAKVYKYEQAHEDRNTILDAIERRFVELPIPTYDALTVEEINGKLDKLSDKELRTIRSYESETKDRTSIIERIDSRLTSKV